MAQRSQGGRPTMTKADRIAERRARAAALREEQRKRERRQRTLWIAGLVALVVVILGGIAAAVVIGTSGKSKQSPPTQQLGPEGIPLQTGPLLAEAPQRDGQPVDGIKCEATEQLVYHIHAHLAIFVNGQQRSVPAYIGIVPNSCLYWIHTHVQDGVLHVESPLQKTFTLGNFFDIWGQPLTGDQVGPEKGTVTAYVNGKPFPGDPRTIPLNPRDVIQLDVGQPLTPPQSVDWSKTQL